MERAGFSHEEQIIILEEGLKSRFWEVYSAYLSQESFTSIGVALSQRAEQREWQAGRASGLKDALNHPSKRIKDLKRLLETKPEGK